MSGRRVSGTKRKARQSSLEPKKVLKFVGLSLSGGKTDKACVAVIDYYVDQNRVFLAKVFEKIRSDETSSADQKIIELLNQLSESVRSVAFDVPLSLPKCIACKLSCPGYEKCDEPQIKWFRKYYAELNASKKFKPRKTFTPYTQRCVDTYLSYGLEENFDIQHTLGANLAPLTARALFLSRRISESLIEVNPKISVWRIGTDLGIPKSHLKYHRHSVGGEDSRRVFLQELAEKKKVFIYQQDGKSMIENNHAFEAFISAYTALLHFMGDTEKRPEGFPRSEDWIVIPKF